MNRSTFRIQSSIWVGPCFQKKVKRKLTNRSPFQTPRGRGIRQNQTSINRTNARKAPRPAPPPPSPAPLRQARQPPCQKDRKTQEQKKTQGQDTKQTASQNKPQSNKKQDQHWDHRPRTASRANHRGFSKFSYINVVGFEILARTPILQLLPPPTSPPRPTHTHTPLSLYYGKKWKRIS